MPEGGFQSQRAVVLQNGANWADRHKYAHHSQWHLTGAIDNSKAVVKFDDWAYKGHECRFDLEKADIRSFGYFDEEATHVVLNGIIFSIEKPSPSPCKKSAFCRIVSTVGKDMKDFKELDAKKRVERKDLGMRTEFFIRGKKDGSHWTVHRGSESGETVLQGDRTKGGGSFEFWLKDPQMEQAIQFAKKQPLPHAYINRVVHTVGLSQAQREKLNDWATTTTVTTDDWVSVRQPGKLVSRFVLHAISGVDVGILGMVAHLIGQYEDLKERPRGRAISDITSPM